MPGWSNVTAGGSATTWSATSGSAATWLAAQGSVYSFAWTPYAPVADLWLGIDFVPAAVVVAPAKASTYRPLVTWDVSTITASSFTAEGAP